MPKTRITLPKNDSCSPASQLSFLLYRRRATMRKGRARMLSEAEQEELELEAEYVGLMANASHRRVFPHSIWEDRSSSFGGGDQPQIVRIVSFREAAAEATGQRPPRMVSSLQESPYAPLLVPGVDSEVHRKQRFTSFREVPARPPPPRKPRMASFRVVPPPRPPKKQ